MKARALCIASALLFGNAFMATAQTGVGVSPPRVTLQASAPATLTQTVSVDHPGAMGPMQVTTSLSDVLIGPDGSTIYLEPGAQPRSLAAWIAVSPLEFELGPQEREEVRYTVDVPADADPGTYWGIIFFESGPLAADDQPDEGFGVRTRVRVGHVVYVNVGQVAREARIVGIRHEANTREGTPGAMRIMFQNTGNGLIRLSGELEIRDLDGQLVDAVEIGNRVSFPGSTHAVSAALSKRLPPGEYVVLAVLDYGGDRVLAGESRFSVP